MQSAVTKAAQNVFRPVGNGFKTRQAQKPACALNRMDEAEDAADQILIVGILLKTQKILVQALEKFVGFSQKLRDEVVHGIFLPAKSFGQTAA